MAQLRLLNKAKLALSHGETVKRYLHPFLPGLPRYLTPRKLANMGLAELDMRRKAVKVRSLPYVLHLEPTNVCTLRCPLCITGTRELQVPTGLLKFERFQQIVDSAKDHVVFMRLDGVGEPFLNPDLLRMIRYAHDAGIGTAISTNFQSVKPERMEEVVRSGLDYMIVSLDGVTQEVFEKYRVGGDIQKVYDNLKAVLEAKHKHPESKLFVEWQFLEFDHNAHEVDEARRQAEALGVSRFLVTDARPSRWKKELVTEAQSTCYWFYKALNVSWTGELKACCSDGLGERWSMGQLGDASLAEVWNGPTLQHLREMFVNPAPYDPSVADSKCVTHCPIVNAGRVHNGLPAYKIPDSGVPTFGDDFLDHPRQKAARV